MGLPHPVLRLPHLTAEMTLLPDLDPTGADRRALAAAAAVAVGGVTGVPHPVTAAARPVEERSAVAA